MRLLLDTHIWLWVAFEPSQLAPRVREVLANPENELWLSPISVWELTLLCRKGRFRVSPDIPSWVAKTIHELYLTEAPLTVEVALAVSALKFAHNDPADGFIAATAKAFELTLVTADEKLARLPGISVLRNR
jgi:PIN domain nuclease of toxin-antitoxin system